MTRRVVFRHPGLDIHCRDWNFELYEMKLKPPASQWEFQDPKMDLR